MYWNSTCWHPLQVSGLDTLTPRAHSFKCFSIFSHNFSIIKNHTNSFFLSQVWRPKSLDRSGWPGTGHFEFQSSSTEELLQDQELLFQRVANFTCALDQEPSRDHQGQVSASATRCSLTAGNAPQGPRSATRGGVGPVRLYPPRAISWCARASVEPEASPFWSFA